MQFVLKMSCPDAVGIAATAIGLLARRDAQIAEMQHFRDAPSNRSFLRIVFGSSAPDGGVEEISAELRRIAAERDLWWRIRPLSHRPRVLIAVSKQGHCLNSLLHSWSAGTLPVDVVGVVSNHENLRQVANWYALPFSHLPIASEAKQAQEERILTLFADLQADLLVLARYMQVLTSSTCAKLAGRAINIHHSFLPSFKGPKPYHQAFARGVKLIGATAHFVNDDLDEGPIIEQDVERVDHSLAVAQLVAIGADIESRVLNRAVQWYAEDRVFEVDGRTVVLK